MSNLQSIRTAWQRWPARRRRLLSGIALLLAAVLVLDRAFPLPQRGRGRDFASVVLARDGTPLRAFPAAGHVWRYPVRLEQVSPLYIQALTGFEDRAFWWHPGVNPLAMLRAGWQWLHNHRVVSGGSTLTMQVARIVDPVPHTLWGKLRQTLRALQLELHYSKREILELYLNYAPMGGTLEGVEAASRAYLGKPSSRLSASEAALLAVLPQAPSRLRPDRYPAMAQAARDKVIRRQSGHWRRQQIDEALAEPLIALPIKDPLLAPLLAERLHRENRQNARIESTIDADAQRTVELLLADRVRAMPPHVSAAAVVLDNRDLGVLAYAGSADYSDRERFAFIDMAQAARSPGSTLKSFLYGMALDDGLLHSESLLSDTPQSFHGYQPGNFAQSFSGPVSMSEALVRSLNVPAVQVLDQLGPQRFFAKLQQGGLKLRLPPGAAPNLSVILGGAATTLEDLVGAYSALARQGVAGKPRLLLTSPRQERRMLSPGAAWIVRDVLDSGGPISRAVGLQDNRHGIAYKTGTSFGFRDAWAVGVTDRYTVGVWMGRPDGTPNPGFFGANSAAPLLIAIFDALPGAGAPSTQRRPDTVSQAAICWPLGTLASTNPSGDCQQTRSAWLLNQTAPPTLVGSNDSGELHRSWYVDDVTKLRVLPGCAAHAWHQVEAPRWPVALEAWLTDDQRRRSLPPDWAQSCKQQADASESLHIQGASDGETITRAANAPLPQVRLNVQGARGGIHWLVNGTLKANSAPGTSQILSFEQPGHYAVTALEDSGRFDRIGLDVR
jgi:penicillin-binding protein 1C